VGKDSPSMDFKSNCPAIDGPIKDEHKKYILNIKVWIKVIKRKRLGWFNIRYHSTWGKVINDIASDYLT
uniref:Uncharacterized protein n=1 Tax=Esox lucius TaxID=8010 RepID=A0A6Q2WSH6_ESOLU